MNIDAYNHIRSGGTGFIELPRGLIAVWGKEAVPFLDGMITNDMKTLGDGAQMVAAFPNAQGRLLAVVRVLRQGDRFFIETEDAMREKVYNNLFRFTYAGDFFAEDISDNYRFIELFGLLLPPPNPDGSSTKSPAYDEFGFRFEGRSGNETMAIPKGTGPVRNDVLELSTDLYEVLRIESGIPKYGIDMDENTIVPELGLEGMISYTKGCYIGQEIIARIHFRGHVAKQLTGLVSEPGAVATGLLAGGDLKTRDGKNAGRITSVTHSPKLDRGIGLGYVRYDFLQEGTQLVTETGRVRVTKLPFA